MKTYQDLLNVVNENEEAVIDFVDAVIVEYQASDLYRTALIADRYDKHQNITIIEYQKLLYKVTGETMPDNYSANFKMACRHFHRFVMQENQYLLGNGSIWEQSDTTPGKLGTDTKPFDVQLQKLGRRALVHGVAYGFFNLDHVDVFSALEFVPLYDEEDGAMKAGIRFWQIAPDKPKRATLYELDGYTDFIWRKGQGEILHEKRPYVLKVAATVADGTQIYDFENYPSFPIVPLWGNSEHQSQIIGLREQIDCYDLIKSGFANTVDEGSLIYWTISNAGGMDEIDLAEFVQRMKEIHAVALQDEGAKPESHQIEVPYESREALLKRLNNDMYDDAMALDVKSISASGNVTATEIQAAYQPLDNKVDDFEYCVREFVNAILALAGIDDNITFTRNKIINVQESMQVLVMASQYLSEEYVTRKALALLGDEDQAEEIMKQKEQDETVAYRDVEGGQDEEQEEGQEEEENNASLHN